MSQNAFVEPRDGDTPIFAANPNLQVNWEYQEALRRSAPLPNEARDVPTEPIVEEEGRIVEAHEAAPNTSQSWSGHLANLLDFNAGDTKAVPQTSAPIEAEDFPSQASTVPLVVVGLLLVGVGLAAKATRR